MGLVMTLFRSRRWTMVLILCRSSPEVSHLPDSRWMVTPEAVVKPSLQNGHWIDELPKWILEWRCWRDTSIRCYRKEWAIIYLVEIILIHEHPLTWWAVGMSIRIWAVLMQRHRASECFTTFTTSVWGHSEVGVGCGCCSRSIGAWICDRLWSRTQARDRLQFMKEYESRI